MTVVPNGVDTEHFRRLELTARERLALLRRWLVDDPRGWDESGRPGSVRYSLTDLSAFADSEGVTSGPAVRRSIYGGETTAAVASGLRAG